MADDSFPRAEHYTFSKNQSPTGHEIWIASRKMPGQVPRLDDLAGGLDPDLVEDFRERADARLTSLSAQLDRDVRAANYGWLPLIARAREGSENRVTLEDSGVVVPGDAQARLYGVLLRLHSGSASARNPSFYGPLFPPKGKPQWQFYTGDSMRDRNASGSLRLAYPDIARLLNSESTYAEIVNIR